jgi:hypothetical protein
MSSDVRGQPSQPEQQDLDDREVKRVFVAGPKRERLTIKVMYHPPDGSAPGTAMPPALQGFVDQLEAKAKDLQAQMPE